MDGSFPAGVVVDEAQLVYGADRRKGHETTGQSVRSAKEIAPIVERWGGAKEEHDGAKRLVLFGDERNQSMRRRFADTGDSVNKCDGCGSERLSCWMSANFDNSFYNLVKRLLNILDRDGDGRLSRAEFGECEKYVGRSVVKSLDPWLLWKTQTQL